LTGLAGARAYKVPASDDIDDGLAKEKKGRLNPSTAKLEKFHGHREDTLG